MTFSMFIKINICFVTGCNEIALWKASSILLSEVIWFTFLMLEKGF